MQRKASAVWKGGLKDGKGTISAPGGVLNDTQYSFTSRFENGPGTNPEELIAAAHAGCFTMALSAALQGAGFTADSLQTTASLSLENVPATSWTITAIHLTTVAAIPGITAEKFAEIAAGAKANCPVSRVLQAEITLDGKLAGPALRDPGASRGAASRLVSGFPLALAGDFQLLGHSNQTRQRLGAHL